jgi:hypothetical protein
MSNCLQRKVITQDLNAVKGIEGFLAHRQRASIVTQSTHLMLKDQLPALNKLK